MPKPLRITYKRPVMLSTVSQADLAEIVALRAERSNLDRVLEDKISLISYAIRHGAKVESGVRTALLREELIVA